MNSKESIKQIVQKVTEDIQLDVFNEKLKDIVNDWSDIEIIRTETVVRIDDKKNWKKIAPVFLNWKWRWNSRLYYHCNKKMK